jgi:predicted O-methyltransferase YrrM
MEITDIKVTQYIDNLYRPLNPFLSSLRIEALSLHIPIILKDTETLLLSLIKIKKPKRILEIGTAVGYSALCFAMLDPEVKVVTIELQERMHTQAIANIEKADRSRQIEVILGDAILSLDSLCKLREEGQLEPFDFVFIDGAKGHYQEIWERSIKLCGEDAIIVSDNVLYRSMTAADEYLDVRRNKTIVNRMRKFLNHITNLNGITTAVLPVGDGIAVSVIEGNHE